MATILTSAIIKNATAEVDAYVATAIGLEQQLDQIMKGLIGTDFSGDAANGFNIFYTQQVQPALNDYLTAQQTSLMAGLKSILDGIETQLLLQVDPQLGQNNQNPSGQ